MRLTSIHEKIPLQAIACTAGYPRTDNGIGSQCLSYSIYSSRIDWRAITPSESEEISDTDRDVWQLLG